ncbi:MAG TPA: Na/Pi cotransporter family protein [Limnochordia bacterium]|nr:Na/Pi cotransporter family protein [Limnochordia bacterium]
MNTGVTIVVGLFGGLGLFLLGIQLLADGLQKAAGERMRRILELFTSKPITAVMTGAAVTALLQSSSTTTVMIVGFVNSGLMTLTQAVGTIMGANIGTTITAQIVSFNIYGLAYPLIAVGALFYYFSQKKLKRYGGMGVLGFGLLLLGLSTMSSSVSPVREYEPFLQLLVTIGDRPILGILAGALFTAIVQSSSATTGLVIAFSWQGILSLPAGLALIVGANLGTCITVVLASLNAPITARRAALSHVLFNLVGVVLFILVRRPFTSLVLTTGSTVARQIANAHTLFNIFTTVIVFPLLPRFVQLVTAIIPGEDGVFETKPKYLDERLIQTPGALISAQKEAVRMGTLAVDMVQHAVTAFIKGETDQLDDIQQREEVVNSLETAITAYLAKANQHSMNESEAREMVNLMHIVNDLERMADHAINITELAEARETGRFELSEAASSDLQNMFAEVDRISRGVLEALAQHNVAQATNLIGEDDKVDDLEKLYRTNHIARLNQGLCSPEAGVLFLDIVSNLERVADHAHNIAEGVADLAFAK